MYHSQTEVKCLPVGRVFTLIQQLLQQVDNSELLQQVDNIGRGSELFLSPNTIGNLLILDKHGSPVGIVDFGYDGNLELWWQPDDDDN